MTQAFDRDDDSWLFLSYLCFICVDLWLIAMTRWYAFSQLVLARVREFYREPEAIFWVYGFPIILAVVLGLAFSGGKPEPPVVDVQAEPDASRAAEVADVLKAAKMEAEVHDAESCKKRLKIGKTMLFVRLAPNEFIYVFDEQRAESVAARYWVDSVLARHETGTQASVPRDDPVTERGSRYIHWL